MDLYVVMIEDLRHGMLEQVMLYAAAQPEDAEALAQAFYVADGKVPGNYRFSAQRVSDVSGPGATRYRVILDPFAPPTS